MCRLQAIVNIFPCLTIITNQLLSLNASLYKLPDSVRILSLITASLFFLSFSVSVCLTHSLTLSLTHLLTHSLTLSHALSVLGYRHNLITLLLHMHLTCRIACYSWKSSPT
jgi:hypothetical protein